MRRKLSTGKVITHCLTFFLLCGCNVSRQVDVTTSDQLMSGDLVPFLERQATNYGGRLNLTGAISCSWRFRSDSNGAQLFTDAKLFSDVDHLFRSALGPPDIATEHKPGRPFVGYNIRKAGVAVQYTIAESSFRDIPNPHLHIIILKQQNSF